MPVKKEESLSKLYAQYTLAKTNGDTLNAKRIKAVIDRLESQKKSSAGKEKSR